MWLGSVINNFFSFFVGKACYCSCSLLFKLNACQLSLLEIVVRLLCLQISLKQIFFYCFRKSEAEV